MIFKIMRVRYGKAGMVALLMAVVSLWACGAEVNEDLIKAAERGDLPEVKRLLDKGADVNANAKGVGHS